MTKSPIEDDTLRELWAVKDATARRFKSPLEYLAYLRAREAASVKSEPKRRSVVRTASAKGHAKTGRKLGAANR